MTRGVAAAVVSLAGLACNVEPVITDSCNVKLEHAPGCPAAALVVMSDYLATQVGLARLDGETLCESLASSARTEASGVALALSGDVVVPSSRPPSGRAVLVDRYGTNVVSWVNPETAVFEGQLALGTGFESNLQDYVELEDGRAFVSRWGENAFSGEEPFDGGGDVLVIDSRNPRILGRVALERTDFPPRPSGMTRVGSQIWVTLQRASLDVRSMGDGEIAGIDTDSESVAFSLVLPGLKNCGPVALSPSGARAAIACTGFIDPTGAAQNLDESALVLLDASEAPPREVERFTASELAGEPLQNELEFASEELVLLKTQTAVGSNSNNRLLAFALANGTAEVLAEAAPKADGLGGGVSFGGILCTPGCDDTCLLADGDRQSLLRWAITPGGLEPLEALPVGRDVGLPPRDLASL
ncbi:MAG TPA: hypothetical protein VGK73_37435 [Polyangiaceae bacterium]